MRCTAVQRDVPLSSQSVSNNGAAGRHPKNKRMIAPMSTHGYVYAICIGRTKGHEKKKVAQAELKENYGFVGDAHAGPGERQVSLLSLNDIQAFYATESAVPVGAFGENLIISGLSVTELEVGREVRIGNARIRITCIGKECHAPCRIYKAMGACLMPTHGVFARVIAGGTVHEHDAVTVLDD